ncbi:MAG: AAA family ATPase [Oscillospiraceae bacterium]|nr:AAA family ATPase [Oscillospiraceae bacterium]
MIIQRMRATFGRLENRELNLRPGLNIISGGNEAGKSTWLAFLLAMFYGIDTADRARADRLPDKQRFLPWNGKPMAGTMELTHNGRDIVLERTSRTGPMADFRAWDAASGAPLEELSGKTCGKTLFGVEAAVYTRSGFLRQQRLAVSPDATLEKRLSGLVTAGSEEYASMEIDEKLKKLQNALRHNRTGALPQAEARRDEIRERLGEIAEKQRELSTLEAELHRLRQQRDQAREILTGLDALDLRKRQGQISNAEITLAAAAEDRAAWEEVCGKLPDEEVLKELEAQVRQLEQELRDAALSEGTQVVPAAAAFDPLFEGMEAEEIHNKVLEDAGTLREALAAAAPDRHRILLRLLLTLPGIGLCVCGALFSRLWLLIGGVVLLLCALGYWLKGCLSLFRKEDEYLAIQQAAKEIRSAYGTDDDQGVMERGLRCLRAMAQQEKDDSRPLLIQKRDVLLARVESIMPGCNTLEKANILFQEAAQSRQALARARLLEQERREQLECLRAALGTPAAQEPDPERFADYDRETIIERLKGLEGALESAAARAAMLEGAIGQMGDSLALNGELEGLERDIRRMEERCAALQLARTTLAQADEALRSRFSPLLCQRTGQLFERLTDGAYDRVQLDRSLRVTVRPAGSPVYRPLSYLSGGTADQLYLALRLAICELLIPNAPIILDDALVFFDDARAALALETLREMSKTRQILVFTSQSREKRILDAFTVKQS